MQIKTTWKYFFSSVRMVITKRSDKCWAGCMERGALTHCWWVCKLVKPLWKLAWRFLKKLKVVLPYDPTILFLVTYPESSRVTIKIFAPHVYCCSIPYKKEMESTNLSISGWMDSENLVCIQNRMLLSFNKKQNHKIHRKMGGSIMYNIKTSSPSKKSYVLFHMLILVYNIYMHTCK